jgi:hypothetical protein
MNFEVMSIRLKDIGTDRYQRRIYPERIDAIIKAFDERLVEPPRVCWRGGKWECWNGHHTLAVLKALGYTHVDCIVSEVASTIDAADLYTKRNNIRFSKPLTPFEDFGGRRVANDTVVHDIDAIIAQYGFKFGQGKSTFTICTIKTPENIYKKYGRQNLCDTLDVIAACYANEPSATNASFMSGLAYFIRRNEGNIKLFTLKKRLSQTNADDIIREAATSRMFKGVKAYETVFSALYDKMGVAS